jgi:glucose/arabinose dehydrogenase/mono/diheme cytochrome c family protein
MTKPIPTSASLLALTLAAGLGALASAGTARAAPAACAGDNGGLKLPPGFCATIFADHIGHARDLAVAADGTVYVNTWSGRYYHNDTPHPGGFIVALKDTTGAGKADRIARFGLTPDHGGHGGTGIYLYNGRVYAEEADRIDAYAVKPGELAPTAKAETVVSGMPLGGDHPMHPFIIDAKGNMFVDMGSATNACQAENRQPRSPGLSPCTELETRGGTWRFDANRMGQTYSAAARYATGIRNGEGFGIDSAGRLYVTQHGRDQLWANWPALFKMRQSAELPAEEVVELKQGGDYGWPECYYDGIQGKLVLAPEYGGDGKKVGVCADKLAPVASFPAHWAPNDLAVYKGDMLPAAYKDALFIAFHGSWNRAPAPQGGFNVVVQPIKDGKASGPWLTFADGFAAIKDPGAAKHRPSGVAVAPDGALFVSDDIGGTIYRITYSGDKGAAVVGVPDTPSQSNGLADAQPPEGTHADAGREAVGLQPPEGATMGDVVLGSRIFHGDEQEGTCAGCHGLKGQGGHQGPSLADHKWLWSDGSFKGIEQTVAAGVRKPKEFSGVMPPMGGSPLTPDGVKAVAAYVWAISHKSGG